MSEFEEVVLRTLAIMLVPVVAGLGLFVKILWTESKDSNPYFNGFVSPANLDVVVERVQNSTVTIKCNDSVGSAFSFKLSNNSENNKWKFGTLDSNSALLLTNYHVIEKCQIDKQNPVVILEERKIVQSKIRDYDVMNDIAVLTIEENLESLLPLWWTLYSGFWVMATGSPFEMEGTVTFGNVINIEGNKIYTSASLNRGNSGGPLTDNEGYVIGINTGYKAVAQNVNWAIDINALCENLVNCSGPFFEDGLIHSRE